MASYLPYSADFFDNEHFVIKGASPVTSRNLVRRSFRNWYRREYPHMYGPSAAPTTDRLLNRNLWATKYRLNGRHFEQRFDRPYAIAKKKLNGTLARAGRGSRRVHL
jgi:hypothetical protein